MRGTLPSAKVTKCHVYRRGPVARKRSFLTLPTATNILKIKYGCVAQLVAQLTLNQLVVGSSPTTPRLSLNGINPLRLNLCIECDEKLLLEFEQAEQSHEVSGSERRVEACVNGNCRIFVASANGGVYCEAQPLGLFMP